MKISYDFHMKFLIFFEFFEKCQIFFRKKIDVEKNIFFEVEKKKLGHSFDAEFPDLSIYDVFTHYKPT